MAQEVDVASRRWWVDDCDFVLTGHADVIKFIDDQARLYNHGAGNLDPQVITDEIPKIAYIAFGTCQQRWTNTHFLDPVRWDESAFYHGGDPVHLSSAVIQQGSEFRVLLAWTRDQRFVDPMNPEAGGTCRYWHLTRTTINGSSPSVEYDPEVGVDSVNSPVVEGETYEYRLFTRPDLQSDWYEIAWPETVTITEQNVAPVFVWLRSVTTTEQFWREPMAVDNVAVEFGYYGVDLDHAVIEARMIWPNASCGYDWLPLTGTEIVGHRIRATFKPDQQAFINSGCIAFRLSYRAGGTDYIYPGGNEVVLSTLNNRLAAQYYAEYVMNPSSPTWQTQVALKSGATITNAADSPYHGAAFDGVLGDNAFAGVDFPMVPVDYQSDAVYQAGMRNLLAAVRDAIGLDHLLVVNAVFSQYHEGQDAEDLDGVVIESLRSRGLNWLSTATHIRDSLAAANVSSDFPVYLYSNAAQSLTEPGDIFPRDRIFELATYFTLRDHPADEIGHPGTDHGHLIFSYRYSGGGEVPVRLSIYPEVTLDLGAPLQDIPPVIEYYPATPPLRDCDDNNLPPEIDPLFTRVYERGLVAVNIGDEQGGDAAIDFALIYAAAGEPLPDMLYALRIDDQHWGEVSADGLVSTTPCTTGTAYALPCSTGVIFLTVATATPQVAVMSEIPLLVGTTSAKLVVRATAGGPLDPCRVLDSSPAQLTGGQWLDLHDDATNGDEIAADGLYTATLNTSNTPPGQIVTLDWQAENGYGLVGMGKVDVPVITQPASTFSDRSNATNDLYAPSFTGDVSSALAFDADGDTRLDLLVSRREAAPELFGNWQNGEGNTPQFMRQYPQVWLPGISLNESYRGMASADIDNDGDLDPVLAHFSNTRLLRNETLVVGQITFSDVSSQLAGEQRNQAACAAWSDVDGDGLVDLFLGRIGADEEASATSVQAPQFVFINRGDHFEPLPLADDPNVSAACYAATWGDIDTDSAPELLVGDAAGTMKIFSAREFDLANDTVKLVECTSDFLLGNGPLNVVAMSWWDLDGAGGSDLALGTLDDEVGLRIYAANGGFLGGVTLSDLGLKQVIRPIVSLATLDYDLNGRPDLLCLHPGEEAPLLLASGYVNNTLVDVSNLVDLGDGAAPTAICADFNNDDGDPDLYLARHGESLPEDRHFYFRNERPTGAEPDIPTAQQKYVKIKLIGGAANSAGLGARVSIPARRIEQLVDGGGHGAQKPSIIEFGLGGFQPATANVDVTWPNGRQQHASVPVNSLSSITYDGASIREDKVISSYSSGAAGTTFVFQWAVDGCTESDCAQSDPADDRVYFLKAYDDQSPCYCEDGVELTSSRPDVTVAIWWDAANQLCRHRLEWTGGCCSVQPSPGCQYRFRVETDLDTGGLLRSVTHDFHSIRACAKVLDPPPDPNNP